MIPASELEKLIFGETGILTKFDNGDHLNTEHLETIYDRLEEYRSAWLNEELVPKDIVALLTSLVFGLYNALPMYPKTPECHYEPTIAKLAIAIEVLFSRDDDLSRGKLRDFINVDF